MFPWETRGKKALIEGDKVVIGGIPTRENPVIMHIFYFVKCLELALFHEFYIISYMFSLVSDFVLSV